MVAVNMRSHLSRMKRIRSFANKPRLDKHEKPNKAKVKKKAPTKTKSVERLPVKSWDTHPIDSGIRQYRRTRYDRTVHKALQCRRDSVPSEPTKVRERSHAATIDAEYWNVNNAGSRYIFLNARPLRILNCVAHVARLRPRSNVLSTATSGNSSLPSGPCPGCATARMSVRMAVAMSLAA